MAPRVINVRTTEFDPVGSVGSVFASNMFLRTNAFSLLHERGRVMVETAHLRPEGPSVCRVRSTGHLVDLTEETAVTVLFPVAGHLRVRVAAADFRITPQSACIFSPNARRTRAEAPGQTEMFHANALLIPYAALRDLLGSALDPSDRWAGLSDGLPVSAGMPEAQRLAALLDYCTGHFDTSPPLSAKAGAAMATLIEELLAELVRRSTPALSEQAVLPAAWRRVILAEEIMRDRSDEPLSMAALAREVGVGLRSLELAFVAVRAMRPRDVLLRIRLERARARLLAASPADTVTTVALDCGFAHLGRFPAAYRMAYGEVPAETLARARRKAS